MDRAFYDAMSHDQLVARLKVAEDALTLIGWTSSNLGQLEDFAGERAKAAEQMWQMWCSMVGGSEFCDPGLHSELNEMIPKLAAQRDAIRAATLRRFGLEPDGEPLNSDDDEAGQ